MGNLGFSPRLLNLNFTMAEAKEETVEDAIKRFYDKSESESKWWIYFTVAINRKGATMTLEGEDESNGSGQPGLRQILIDASDKCIVALLRVGSTDRGGSKRSKFIYIQYCGNDVGVMKKAKFPMAISKLSPAFSAK